MGNWTYLEQASQEKSESFEWQVNILLQYTRNTEMANSEQVQTKGDGGYYACLYKIMRSAPELKLTTQFETSPDSNGSVQGAQN